MNQTDREESEMLRRRQNEDDTLRGVYIGPSDTRYGLGRILESSAFEKKNKINLKNYSRK